MAAVLEVDFFNTYLLKKRNSHLRQYNTTIGVGGDPAPAPGNATFFPRVAMGSSLGDPINIGGTDIAVFPNRMVKRWYIEESRIRGGYNNVSTDQGVRAYLDDENPLQQRRINTLIYSGIYNSRTGINQTNVFSIGESITKSLDISYGSIQKTYAEDTNLIVFQENKIHRALIDKDTIYTTESGTQTQAAAAVIGQFVSYKGDYGISKNPESFAIYNYRKYFSDKNRNAIMRLSNDGLTEISRYGMLDYFRDNLAEVSDIDTLQSISTTKVSGGEFPNSIVVVASNQAITSGMSISGQAGYVTCVFKQVPSGDYQIYYSAPFSSALPSTIVFNYKTKGKVIGGWDIHNKNYVVSMQKNSNQVSTDLDGVNDLTDPNNSYSTLVFDEDINGWVSFFTYKPNFMFSNLNRFYSIKNAGLYEHYDVNASNNTRGDFYSVRNPSNITFVFNPQPDVVKNFNTISYEGSNGWEVVSYVSGFTGQDLNPNGTSTYVQNNDNTLFIKSYSEGSYVDANTGYTLRSGFDRKENRYVANLRNNSTPSTGEIIFGAQMSGIKGYFATVKIETDETTQLGGPKELWAAATNFVTSSY